MSKTNLILGNCLEILSTLKDKIDMVLCDLPYGRTQNKWDSVIPLEPLWREWERLCSGPIVLTAIQPFTSILVMSNLKWFRHEWVWEKNKCSGHLNCKKRPLRAHEDILVFSKETPAYIPQMTNGHEPGHYAVRRTHTPNYGAQRPTVYGGSTSRYPRSVVKFPIVNNDDPERIHPTQKPVELMKYLIRTYSKENDTVLDCCMGSGSTGIACILSGRNFIGIEDDESMFAEASVRMDTFQESYVLPQSNEQDDPAVP